MLVRSSISEGHSHVWELPAEVPAERGVFWSQEDDFHSHALIFGGNRGRGNLVSEPYGSDNSYVYNDDTGEFQDIPTGDVHPEQPDSRRPHTHIIPVLL